MLETLGQDLRDEAIVYEIDRPKPGEPAPIVLLDRVGPDLPDYCTHGYVTCVRCERLCWLGDKTKEVIANKEAFPVCLTCATEILPPGARPESTLRVEDHRRADGPHE
jgi:hypothetical protein